MTGYYRKQVSEIAGINRETLLFYEKRGLIPLPQRTGGGYRIYDDDVFNRIAFIKLAKSTGFKLVEIRQLLSIMDSKNIDQPMVSEVIAKKIQNIEREMSDLNSMKAFLMKVKDNLENPESCPILQSMLGRS